AYLSAIFYQLERLPESFTIVVELNPVYQLINLMRSALYYGTFPTGWSVTYIVVWSLGVFIFGTIFFAKQSRKFIYFA
ncbi:MAG: ABC transporter permease, partial [Chloroflexota bacterium]